MFFGKAFFHRRPHRIFHRGSQAHPAEIAFNDHRGPLHIKAQKLNGYSYKNIAAHARLIAAVGDHTLKFADPAVDEYGVAAARICQYLKELVIGAHDHEFNAFIAVNFGKLGDAGARFIRFDTDINVFKVMRHKAFGAAAQDGIGITAERLQRRKAAPA